MVSMILPRTFFGVNAFPKTVMEWSGWEQLRYLNVLSGLVLEYMRCWWLFPNDSIVLVVSPKKVHCSLTPVVFIKHSVCHSGVYKKVFQKWNEREFVCRENDYVVDSDGGREQRKVGGNAQVGKRKYRKRVSLWYISGIWSPTCSSSHFLHLECWLWVMHHVRNFPFGLE